MPLSNLATVKLTAYPGHWRGELNQLNTISNCTLRTGLKTTTLGACRHSSMTSQTMNQQTAHLSDELNNFYARFDRGNTKQPIKAVLTPDDLPLTLSTSDVCATLCKVNAHKAAGPDGIPGRALRACAEQLAEVFTSIFNLSLAQAIVPNCFKTANIVPVPKQAGAVALNDFRPVALTPIIAKCFERLVLSHLKACLPPILDPYQFAYKSNRSTEDAIASAFHSDLTHLDRTITCQDAIHWFQFRLQYSDPIQADLQAHWCWHQPLPL